MMDEEDEHSPTSFIIVSWGSGNFWYRKWNRYHQKTIDDFINQQKIANKNKKTATDTDMNTFLFGGGGGGGGGKKVNCA